MRRIILPVVTLFAAVSVLVSGTAPASETPSSRYPHYTTGATSEAENEERIDFVSGKLQKHVDKRGAISDDIDNITERIKTLKARRENKRIRRAAVNDTIGRYRFLLQSLKAIRGYVTEAFNCRMGESTNNYEAHGDHPNGEQVHGAYQALNSTFDNAYGYADAHTAPFFVQDRWYIDMVKAGRGGEFAAPGC